MRELSCTKCQHDVPADQPVFIASARWEPYCEECRDSAPMWGYRPWMNKYRTRDGLEAQDDGRIVVVPKWDIWKCESCGRGVVRTLSARTESSYSAQDPYFWSGERIEPRYTPYQFCSDACMSTHYRKRKESTEITCQHCGEAFKAKRNDAKYCSPRCRVAAHRKSAA